MVWGQMSLFFFLKLAKGDIPPKQVSASGHRWWCSTRGKVPSDVARGQMAARHSGGFATGLLPPLKSPRHRALFTHTLGLGDREQFWHLRLRVRRLAAWFLLLALTLACQVIWASLWTSGLHWIPWPTQRFSAQGGCARLGDPGHPEATVGCFSWLGRGCATVI